MGVGALLGTGALTVAGNWGVVVFSVEGLGAGEATFLTAVTGATGRVGAGVDAGVVAGSAGVGALGDALGWCGAGTRRVRPTGSCFGTCRAELDAVG